MGKLIIIEKKKEKNFSIKIETENDFAN